MEELIPSKFYLSQNSPNPFTDSTKIKYCLPVKTKVYLTVFNAKGEMIVELVNKIQDAGTYEIKFNGNALSQSDYYFKLQARDPLANSGQDYTKTRKMLLRK